MQAEGPALVEEEETAVLGLGRETGGCAQASADETHRRGQLEWNHPRQEWPYAWWVITPGEQVFMWQRKGLGLVSFPVVGS